MILITKQLADKLPINHELLLNRVVNPLDYSALHLIITKAQQIVIYDATKTKTLPPETIIGVYDHINRTGKNPLIGNQKKYNIDFIDITGIYSRNKTAIKTDCCGNKLNKRYLYPSHYLCIISIMAKAHGINKISAFLVNIL